MVSTLNTPLTSLILEVVWKRFLKEVSMLVRMTDLRLSRAFIACGAAGLEGEPIGGVAADENQRRRRRKKKKKKKSCPQQESNLRHLGHNEKY